MKGTETAWSKGFKPRDSSNDPVQKDNDESQQSRPVRKSYAAASAVTLPQNIPSLKNSQRLSSILGKPNSSQRYNKTQDRGNRRVRQRSAFGNVDREERERERQIRKEKYSKVEKQRYALDDLLAIRKSQNLQCAKIKYHTDFEGLQLDHPVEPVLEENFDAKQHTSEWYENLKKERAEKVKRYSEREKLRKSSVDRSPNPWRSPAWNQESPTVTPEAFDLEKISKMTANMSSSKPSKEEPSFELADMAAKAQQFEEENREKQKEDVRKMKMPSFFENTTNTNSEMNHVLNSALEDCTRPPEEEIIPTNEGIIFKDTRAEEEEKLRLEQEAWQRENARMEYLRRKEEALRISKQREYDEMMQRQHISRERERQRMLHMQRQQHQVSFLPSEWFYRDPQGHIQGPYSSQTMRTWLERKFFKDDLPIAENSPRNRFHPIRQVFPDPRTAFLDIYRRQEYPEPRPHPVPSYFSQSSFEEQQPQRLSEYDIQRLKSQAPVVQMNEDPFQKSISLNQPEPTDLDDFLDLSGNFEKSLEVEKSTTEAEVSQSKEVIKPVKSKDADQVKPKNHTKTKSKTSKKKNPKKGNELPVKLEGLSDNLKKMLGVSKTNKPVPTSPQEQAKANPWKKPEKQAPSSVSLRQIQEEEQQKLNQDIINGTHQPNQSKVWANLVASNAPVVHSKNNSSVLPNSQDKKKVQERKKFLTWYRGACNSNKFGFDERLFNLSCSLSTPAEIRAVFKTHFGNSQQSVKFATEFLNMKEKFSI